MKESVLIIGGRSDIGLAIAHQFAKSGHPIQLAARNANNLIIEKNDIENHYGVKVTTHEFDVLEIGDHEKFVASLPILPDIAICAVGLMGNQKNDEHDYESAIKIMRSNYEGPVNIFSILVNHFEKRGSGTLVGITSVSGIRGRASNYIYGSAKSGFNVYLSGLRNRQAKKGVHVVTVLLGFVATKMTKNIRLPKLITANAKLVGLHVKKACIHKKDIIYVKPIWRWIMLIIKMLPERYFKTINF